MKASEIFEEYIGKSIRPIIVAYEPYKDNFKTFPYRHVFDSNFEQEFSKIMFDSIVFYAYEKSEIEHEYSRGHFANLSKVTRMAYENRVPKTERENDGLLGELALDTFIKCFFEHIEMLYSRVKYLERYPKKEIEDKRKGHEVKGYDSLLFSVENQQKYMWIGQVKTGSWEYCSKGIKEDINKSILEHYFSSAMMIMADVMHSMNSNSPILQKVIDDLNEIIFENTGDTALIHSNIQKYFFDENIIVRVPCLMIVDENNYKNEAEIFNIIKEKCKSSFDGFVQNKNNNLNVEVFLLVFPVRNLQLLRKLFLNERNE